MALFAIIFRLQGEDGDPSDVLLLMNEAAFPGCRVHSRLIGVSRDNERHGPHRERGLVSIEAILYSSYVLGATVACGLSPEASFWDTAEPYHYLRVEAGKARDYVIFGGEDHKTGQDDDPEACYARLEDKLRKLIPKAKVDHRWSGQLGRNQ